MQPRKIGGYGKNGICFNYAAGSGSPTGSNSASSTSRFGFAINGAANIARPKAASAKTPNSAIVITPRPAITRPTSKTKVEATVAEIFSIRFFICFVFRVLRCFDDANMKALFYQRLNTRLHFCKVGFYFANFIVARKPDGLFSDNCNSAR